MPVAVSRAVRSIRPPAGVNFAAFVSKFDSACDKRREQAVAIAAQLAYPNRQSVAIIGDGGFTQLMGELHWT